MQRESSSRMASKKSGKMLSVVALLYQRSAYQTLSLELYVLQIIAMHSPSNLQFIEHGAFYGCSSLEAICIPPAVTHIGSNAFHACTSQRIINIPENVYDIRYDRMGQCDDLLTNDTIHISCRCSQQYQQWFRV